MSDVFISYARASARVHAQSLRDALRVANIEVFLDEEGIPPGSPFPTRIADAILAARIMVVFPDQTYFSRPWCVYEFQVGVAPYQALGPARPALSHLVIALPAAENPDQILAHFPPALAELSWPRADQPEELVKLIAQQLSITTNSMTILFEGLDNEAVKSLRSGALVPPPSKPHSGKTYLGGMPPSLKGEFVGRTEVLWEVFNALETKSPTESSRSCSLQGGAGMGKTQVAAEYVSRYGPKHYPGGIVWIDASGRDADLASQFRHLLSVFSDQKVDQKTFEESAAEELSRLANAVKETFAALPVDQSILWVIDNVPEPEKGRPPAKLSRWCPARDYVSLLCTSRHAGIKDVERTIQLSELSPAGAVELLIQAPVKKSWLSDEQWIQVASWIGCWPLGLRILHTSLAEGFITADKLAAKARGDEPAAALDAEVEALRDEVFEGYLHGVAEVFHVSYETLAARPDAQLGAHVLARLARTPVSENLLSELFQNHELGVLAKRSWIQPIDESAAGEGRRWSMHRVAASYLRGVSPDPGAEFAQLIDWFSLLFRPDREWAEVEPMRRHFRVFSLALADWLHSHPDPKLLASARALAITLATWHLSDKEPRAFRFLAAQFAELLGAGDELANNLAQRLVDYDDETARNIFHSIGGLARSAAAAAFLIQALADPRDFVRWLAFVTAGGSARSDLLAVPLLDAYLLETNQNILSQAEAGFSQLLKAPPAVLRDLVSQLAYHLGRTDALHRKLIAGIYGRILHTYGDQFEAGGWRSAHVRGALLSIALEDDDAEVAAEACSALAFSEHPTTVETLTKNLEDTNNITRWRRAVDCLVNYVSAFERPGIPHAQWVEQEGEFSLRVDFGTPGKYRLELYQPLLNRLAETADQGCCDYAIDALGRNDSGKAALQRFIPGLFEAGRLNDIIRIAEASSRKIPSFAVNAFWWRGQAHENLGNKDEAIADYGRVIELKADFVDAYICRARLRNSLADYDGASKDFSAAIELEPMNLEALQGRAFLHQAANRHSESLADVDAALTLARVWNLFHLRAVCLLNLGRNQEAVEAETSGIELNGQVAELWFIRGVAYLRLGKTAEALNDLQQAKALDPADTRIQEHLDFLVEQTNPGS